MKIIINGEIVEVAEGGSGDTTFLVKAPIGTIVIWSGTADNIPSGWQLCDGTNGTPDLRDKFVLGAGTAHSVGETGGSEEVTLTVEQMPSHKHTISSHLSGMSATSSRIAVMTQMTKVENQETGYTGSSQPHPNMPPYYALCYIMKMTADPAVDGVTMDQVNTAIQTAVADIQPQEVYSTEETRIGTWIDGKPLYRRVIRGTFGTGTSNTYSLAALGSHDVIDAVCRVEGYWYTDKYLNHPQMWFPSGTVLNPADEVLFSVREERDGNICLYAVVKDGLAASAPYWAILEYTKTTDEAAS